MEIEREMPHQDKKENEYKKRPILPLPAFFAK